MTWYTTCLQAQLDYYTNATCLPAGRMRRTTTMLMAPEKFEILNFKFEFNLQIVN